jgi:F0F1-type ATP synthase assembly protein I
MSRGPPDSKELGYYFALAQVGLEMVVPIGLGVALDSYFRWTPWGAVAGAVVGLVLGITHIVLMVNRHDRAGSSKPPREPS